MKSALLDTHLAAGARVIEVDGWQSPDEFSSFVVEYDAAHAGAVVYDASAMGRLRLTGKTRLDFLNRMSTNDMNALQPGQGAATILTTPNARIVDRILVYVRQADLLVLTSRGAQDLVARWLKKYIFFNDDVQVRDLSSELWPLSIYGTKAAEVAAHLCGGAVDDLALHAWRSIDETLSVARTDSIAGDGFHLLAASTERLSDLWSKAVEAGASPIGERALEVLRIESGRPRFGRELSEAYIPLEAGLWADVSFSKGCYVGQEIIARMESRHRLAKQMVGLRADRSIDLEAEIYTGDESIGKVSSAAMRPCGDSIGLGFVKPAYASPDGRVWIGADRSLEAEVVSFPIARP